MRWTRRFDALVVDGRVPKSEFGPLELAPGVVAPGAPSRVRQSG